MLTETSQCLWPVFMLMASYHTRGATMWITLKRQLIANGQCVRVLIQYAPNVGITSMIMQMSANLTADLEYTISYTDSRCDWNTLQHSSGSRTRRFSNEARHRITATLLLTDVKHRILCPEKDWKSSRYNLHVCRWYYTCYSVRVYWDLGYTSMGRAVAISVILLVDSQVDIQRSLQSGLSWNSRNILVLRSVCFQLEALAVSAKCWLWYVLW